MHIYIDVVLRVLYELERVLNVELIQLIYDDFLLQVFVYGSNWRSTFSVHFRYISVHFWYIFGYSCGATCIVRAAA